MKKVALITCFLDNYGACLQALALQNQIEKLGCECNIIAYIGNDGYFQDDFFTILKMKIKNIALIIWNVLHGGEKTGPYTKHFAFCKFRKKFLRFEKVKNTNKVKFYNSIDEMADLSEKYDAFVCGSDQLWNPTFYNQNHPVHFLRFAGDKKRIAYAPSIGVSEMPAEYRKTFIEYIADFNSLSVREQAGSEIIRDLCSREAKVVLDPTLLAGADFWNTLLKPAFKAPFEKYIFCYIFSNTQKCSDFLKSAQAKTNLPIVYVDISNLSYDGIKSFCVKDKGPIEFLQLLKNAEFVITDSFHGTAFSLLFNKDFYVLKRERTSESYDMFSRIESILNITDLESRFCSLDNEFEEKNSICYSTVNKKFEELRKFSTDYLHDAIFGEIK